MSIFKFDILNLLAEKELKILTTTIFIKNTPVDINVDVIFVTKLIFLSQYTLLLCLQQ